MPRERHQQIDISLRVFQDRQPCNPSSSLCARSWLEEFMQKIRWAFTDVQNLQSSCISARPAGFVLEGDLIRGAKDSIILEKEGRFQGSLQVYWWCQYKQYVQLEELVYFGDNEYTLSNYSSYSYETNNLCGSLPFFKLDTIECVCVCVFLTRGSS